MFKKYRLLAVVGIIIAAPNGATYGREFMKIVSGSGRCGRAGDARRSGAAAARRGAGALCCVCAIGSIRLALISYLNSLIAVESLTPLPPSPSHSSPLDPVHCWRAPDLVKYNLNQFIIHKVT